MGLIQIPRQELNSHPKVNAFLDSIGRESLHSRNTYATGFVHFQTFLDKSEEYRQHTPDSIIATIDSENHGSMNEIPTINNHNTNRLPI